ncbi:Protein TSSC1 [Galdieria sulphuraria]|uniref:Transducin family protein / WD-40 repeat family protein n=1 Tax=Galdieria sulphuraria TaxID=130081 RepID=M2Y335_GALSU|nr:transducin family protein / WD-40 repeat family protein [Galdieria sulphuraria]EME30338.1 transducin family protein / WD-40 repeat family protein [Galdieria sulphuraria]GJD13000.1 Protein TSSC1 [Galdieria sulphuraria]|eukprot:XP_005706858.1 transducin family protein / WD-40 repeat family protein [Galdieria sulphuraria]
MSKYDELSTPVIYRSNSPLKSLIALGTNEEDYNDYFVLAGDEPRGRTHVSLYRVNQLVDTVESQCLLETRWDASSSNLVALKDGLFASIVEESTHPGTLWLNIYNVLSKDDRDNIISEKLQTKSCIRLDNLETSLSYVNLIANRSTCCQIATVSCDKLLIHDYEKDLNQNFHLTPQDCCYWKPCGDWQPDNSGNHLIIGRGQSVQLWDIRSQDTCADFGVFPNFGQILALRYFPLRQHFVMGGFSSGKVVVWDTRSSLEPILSWTAHHHAILDLKSNWSHERLVATCGTDAIIHIWDMKELFSMSPTVSKGSARQQPSYVKCSSLEYHSDTIHALEWGISNEFTIASVGYDGNFILTTIPSFVRDKVFT